MTRKFPMSVVLSFLLLAANAFAQGEHGGRRGPGGAPPDPQQMAQHRVDRLAERLNLTDAQKSQAVAIFANAAQLAQPLHQQSRETRKLLQDAVSANNVAQIDQLASTLGTLTAQLIAIESRAEAQFLALLTPEQRANLPSRGFGGPGFGGPPSQRRR